MGKLIIPNEIRINGPWLLNEKSLEDLHESIVLIEKRIDDAYEIDLKNSIEKDFQETKRWRATVTKEEIAKRIDDRLKDYNSRKFILFSKDDKRIEDDSILNLLKDKNINSFSPTKLLIKIIKGTIEFELVISSSYNDELQTRLRINNEDLAIDINYELNKWIRKYQPNIAMQKWNSWSPLIPVLMLIYLILFSLIFLRTNYQLYRDDLLNQSVEILKDGVSKEEENMVMEIILKIETKYLPIDYKSEVKNNQVVMKIWIIAAICTFLLIIKPKTTLGIGKNKHKLTFMVIWSRFVLIFIPLSILLPIVLNKLL